MPQGMIVRTASALFAVKSGDAIYECRPRGRFRRDGVAPMAGDQVLFEVQKDGSGVLTEILPRRNSLVRPLVANVDKLILVCSAAPPVTGLQLIDSFTALAAMKGIEPVICVNKTDLDGAADLIGLYRGLGYVTIPVSAATGEGLDQLAACMRGVFCVLTGNSGVGKSSLFNGLFPGVKVRTGELSQRIGRGRQTTRHVELLPTADGGYLADTPGFSSFDPVEMEMTDAARLPYCFPEFVPYLGSCRYNDCSHVRDEGCAVLRAMSEGKIAHSRHESFTYLYNSVKDLRAWNSK